MIRVRMKTTMAGPNGTASPNGTVLVPEQEATDLVAGGYAEYVDSPPTTATGEATDLPPAAEAGTPAAAATPEHTTAKKHRR